MTLQSNRDTAEWTRLKEVERLARELVVIVRSDSLLNCDPALSGKADQLQSLIGGKHD